MQARVRPSSIVHIEVLADAGTCLRDRVVSVKVNLFILHRPPQPFDEDIVAPGAFAVHADLDVILLEKPRERL